MQPSYLTDIVKHLYVFMDAYGASRAISCALLIIKRPGGLPRGDYWVARFLLEHDLAVLLACQSVAQTTG